MSETAPPELKNRGCGVLAYAGILGLIFTAGMTGMSLSMWVLYESGAKLSPMNLSYGGVVDAHILAPMRVAGLIGQEEIPDAFHAERLDGSVACAISRGALLRLGPDGEKEQVLLQDIQRVDATETDVKASGATGSVTCYFNAGEGADRLARMLQAH